MIIGGGVERLTAVRREVRGIWRQMRFDCPQRMIGSLLVLLLPWHRLFAFDLGGDAIAAVDGRQRLHAQQLPR